MDLVDILIPISTLVFILILWVIVGYRHFKHLKITINEQWEVLDEGLRKRHNLLPNLIETVRMFIHDQDQLLEQMVNQRIKVAKEYFPGAKKIEFEYDLSKSIDEIIDLGRSHQELSKNTNFLELRKEIDDLEQNIEEKSNKYNEMVRYYNNHKKLLVLRPLATIFGFKVENIFEFEV